MIIDIFFKRHIDYLDIESIKKSHDVIYIVDEKMILRAYNHAWIKFAKDNHGAMILAYYSTGSNIADAFTGPIKDYLIGAYKKALQENKPFEHDYECPSAAEYRLFHQTAYPIVESRGLVISNHLVKTCSPTETAHEFKERFVNEHGIVVQCSNCRKIRDSKNDDGWLWVPEFIEKPYPKTSHGICPRCLDHYYPEIDD
jgi:hypothetical protein